jgi:hypothetical protein
MAQPSPYYIIVSDEGPSTHPKKHSSYGEAETEARRLSALKPGINFGIYEVKSSFFTPKAETTKTTYGTSWSSVGPVYYRIPPWAGY